MPAGRSAGMGAAAVALPARGSGPAGAAAAAAAGLAGLAGLPRAAAGVVGAAGASAGRGRGAGMRLGLLLTTFATSRPVWLGFDTPPFPPALPAALSLSCSPRALPGAAALCKPELERNNKIPNPLLNLQVSSPATIDWCVCVGTVIPGISEVLTFWGWFVSVQLFAHLDVFIIRAHAMQPEGAWLLYKGEIAHPPKCGCLWSAA